MQTLVHLGVDQILGFAAQFDGQKERGPLVGDKSDELFEIFHAYTEEMELRHTMWGAMFGGTTKCCASGTCEIRRNFC